MQRAFFLIDHITIIIIMKPHILITALALFSLASCAKKENPAAIAKAKADSMETAYKSFIAAWDASKVDEFDKYVGANCLENYQPKEGVKSGIEGLKQMATIIHTALPDNKTTLSHLYNEGDTLNLNYTDTGMNTGPLNGMPATNEKMTGSGNYHVRWQNGKFIELASLMDHGYNTINTGKMMQDFNKPEADKPKETDKKKK